MQNPFSKSNLVSTLWPGLVSAGPSVLLGATITPELFAVSPSLMLLGAGYSAFKGTKAAYVTSGKRHRDRSARQKELDEAQRQAQDAYMQEALDAIDPETLKWLAANVRVSEPFIENNPEVALDLKQKLFKTTELQVMAKLLKPTEIRGVSGRQDGVGSYAWIEAPSRGRDGCKCTQCRLAALQEKRGITYKVVNQDGTPIRDCEKGKKSVSTAKDYDFSLPKGTKPLRNLEINDVEAYLDKGVITAGQYASIVRDMRRGHKAALVVDEKGSKRIVTDSETSS